MHRLSFCTTTLVAWALPAFAFAAPAACASQSSSWELKDWVTLISALTAIVAIIVGALVNWITLKVSRSNTEAALWQKANETELSAIQTKLDDFYGPFMHLSGSNRLLSRDLRSRQADSDTFLLIEKLFDREWLDALPKGERAIVDQMATNARALRELIAERAGMVDAQILEYLSRVSAHYKMIELAHQGELGDDPKLFVDRYVFPYQIDGVLKLEVARLDARRDALRAHPYKAPGPLPPLAIPEDLMLPEWVYPPRTPRRATS